MASSSSTASSKKQTDKTDSPNSNTPPGSNVYSNQNFSAQPQRRPSSSSSASTSPAPASASTPGSTSTSTPTPKDTATLPQQQQQHTQGHTQTNSHGQSYQQHSQPHMGMGGIGMGMMSAPLSMGHMPATPMGVGSIPGAPFYYPYSLFPSHSHIPPHHGHHGPPPPHPPAPPAPPRASRTNSIYQSQASGGGGGDVNTLPFSPASPTSTSTLNSSRTSRNRNEGESDQSRQNGNSGLNPLRGIPRTSSASPSTSSVLSPTNSTLQSSFPTTDTARPQLVPTFSYYRTRANYDQQHGGEPYPGGIRGHQTTNPTGTAPSNNNGGGDEDENGGDMGDYDVTMPMATMDMPSEMGLSIDPSLVPSTSSVTPSSSGPNFTLQGAEKKANHEYYPSPHHQAQFRDLVTDPSVPLPDPPISLNSLVDSEPGKKPAYPLPTIIRCAILGSPHQRLTLSELYLAMERRFSYYTIGDGKSWRNSVRHNLSLNNLFEKVARPITEPGKGCYWVVAHDKPPGNKRERKRNKKPGKRALAAMEREKAAAAAAGVGALPRSASGDGRTDDEDDDAEENEDDVDDSREQDEMNLASASTSATMRTKTGPTTSSNTAPFSSNPLSPTISATTTVPATTRPFFSFSRGTVAPNEGSYAAVTGVVPMPSQIPLPESFRVNSGVSGYGGSSGAGFGVGSRAVGSGSSGPFSAFANAGSGAFGSAGSSFGNVSMGMEFDTSSSLHPNASGTASTDISPPISIWSANRASSPGPAAAPDTTSKGKGKSAATNGRVVPVNPGIGGKGKQSGTMSQPSPSRDQDSGTMGLSQTDSSQESGAVFGDSMVSTQGTSIQASQPPPIQSQERVSTTPFGQAQVLPSPGESLLPLSTPLSAQSSLSSAGFSIPESVSSGSGNTSATNAREKSLQQQKEGPGPHRTTRQNPTRRFDPVTSGSNTSSSTSVPQTRPRDTFNALAAQIASEFQTSATSDSNRNASPSADATPTRRTARPRPLLRSARNRPPGTKRGSDSGSGSGSLSDRSAEEESDEEGDEYVPSGLARRSGRRK